MMKLESSVESLASVQHLLLEPRNFVVPRKSSVRKAVIKNFRKIHGKTAVVEHRDISISPWLEALFY